MAESNIPARSARVGVPPWGLAVAAMLSIQLCSALSVGFIDQVGPAGTAWLRTTMGALILLVFVRPPMRQVRRADVPVVVGLGLATGFMAIGFLAAIDRIPLGTAVAIEFLGPLTVAAVRSSNRKMLLWPLLALVGVVLLTEPWQGEIDLVGVAFAAGAGVCWGAYILLTQLLGDRFSGASGLAMTIPIAALVTAIFGIPQAVGNLTWGIVLGAIGLALLAPVLPFIFELSALRRMTYTAFGTLMSLEPAFGVLMGVIVLTQTPTVLQVVGTALVVIAGAAAQRGGRRAVGTHGEYSE